MNTKKKYVPAWFTRKNRTSEIALNANMVISAVEDQMNMLMKRITHNNEGSLESISSDIDRILDEVVDVKEMISNLNIPEIPNEIYETNEIVENIEQKVLSIDDSVHSIDNTMGSIEYSIDEEALPKIKDILESGKSADGMLKAIHKIVTLVAERQYYFQRNKE